MHQSEAVQPYFSWLDPYVALFQNAGEWGHFLQMCIVLGIGSFARYFLDTYSVPGTGGVVPIRQNLYSHLMEEQDRQ